MRTLSFIVMIVLIISCASEKDQNVFKGEPIEIKIPCSIDTIIMLSNGVKLNIDSNSFVCTDQNELVEMKVWVSISKVDMIKNKLSTHAANQQILESLGMIKIESELQIQKLNPVEVEFPNRNRMDNWESFKLEEDIDIWQQIPNIDTIPNSAITSEEESGSDDQYYYTYAYDSQGNVSDSVRLTSVPNQIQGENSKSEFNYLIRIYSNSWYNVDRFIDSENLISSPQLTINDFQPDRTFALLAFQDRTIVLKFEKVGEILILSGSKGKPTIRWPENAPVTIIAFEVNKKGHVNKANFLKTQFVNEKNNYNLVLENMDKTEFEYQLNKL